MRAGVARGEGADPAKLSRLNVDQFFGIEIDEFPARIAEVALWMTDHIANVRLGDDFGESFARIPLVAAPNISHADALELDWNELLPAERCSYVLGNPPFVGAKLQSEKQRAQVRSIARLGGSGGTLDYVAAWFIKAGEYVRSSSSPERGGEPAQLVEGAHASAPQTIGGVAPGSTVGPLHHPSDGPPPRSGEDRRSPQIAFVATNSITQGEQVAQLWPILFHRLQMEIAFGHRTFVWPGRAGVHCVIAGLARAGEEPAAKRLFFYLDGKGQPIETNEEGLTAYLFAAKGADRHLVVTEQRTPLTSAAPIMRMGSKIVDGGHYIFDGNQRAAFLLQQPEAEGLLVPLIGSKEYIQGGRRWILDLQDVAPNVLRTMPHVRERIGRVRAFREASKKQKTRELAGTPLRFEVNTRPAARFLVVPEVSSERRDYVPIGWIEERAIPSNLVQTIENATLWHFGMLTSAMHMAWLRHIGGRLKSDFRYSIGLVYNTFPWPDATSAQQKKIEALAQAVLDARALPKNATSSLADLYDPDTMPAELRKAHRELDAAVDKLYRARAFDSDRERVEHLFPLYEALVQPTSAAAKANKRTAKRVARTAKNVI